MGIDIDFHRPSPVLSIEEKARDSQLLAEAVVRTGVVGRLEAWNAACGSPQFVELRPAWFRRVVSIENVAKITAHSVTSEHSSDA